MVLLNISTLAKDILVILIIKLEVKRLFNIARNIIIYRRSKPISITIEVIIIIRYNKINNTYNLLIIN